VAGLSAHNLGALNPEEDGYQVCTVALGSCGDLRQRVTSTARPSWQMRATRMNPELGAFDNKKGLATMRD
jgi:hypothetical protein